MDQRFEANLVNLVKYLYCMYRQKYVVMTPEYTKTVKHYFKESVIESHLNGQYALCVFAGEKITKFISFDVDAGGRAAVRKIIDALAEIGLPRDKIYVSTSGRKGYHVDVFFEPYIYNTVAKNLYDLVIWRTELDPTKVEFRPTNTHAIKVPLGLHAKTGTRCWYLDPETFAPIEDMNYIATIQTIPATDLHQWIKTWNYKRWNELYIEMVCEDRPGNGNGAVRYDYSKRSEYFASHRLTAANTRHDMMLGIAYDVRQNGLTAPQIERFLMGWYREQDPIYISSTEDEVRLDARDIAEWAEQNVKVVRQTKLPENQKPIVFTKDDINYILMAPTSVARRVAVLLWTYCKMFGAAKISYGAIADTVGCVAASAQTAVAALLKADIIHKDSGGLRVVNGKMIRKANTYFMPQRHDLASPPDDYLLADEYAYTGAYKKEEFDKFYYSVLGGLCRDEYLEKFLTKSEMDGVRSVRC